MFTSSGLEAVLPNVTINASHCQLGVSLLQSAAIVPSGLYLPNHSLQKPSSSARLDLLTLTGLPSRQPDALFHMLARAPHISPRRKERWSKQSIITHLNISETFRLPGPSSQNSAKDRPRYSRQRIRSARHSYMSCR